MGIIISGPVALSPFLLIIGEASLLHFTVHLHLVNLVVVQIDIDILVLNLKEFEDASSPIELVLDDRSEEGLNSFNGVLGAFVEDLGYINVLGLMSSGDIFPSGK